MEVIPRSWNVVPELALPKLFITKPPILPCKDAEISAPLTPTIRSSAFNEVMALVTCFLIMFPRVMISSLNPAWSLTIENAASSPYTLTVSGSTVQTRVILIEVVRGADLVRNVSAVAGP